MKSFKRFLSALLMIVMVMSLMPQTVRAAKLPGITDKATEKNVLALLDKYDSNGAYIMRTMKSRGDDWLKNYFPSNYRITQCIGTAVHEENHGFTYGGDQTFQTLHFYTKNKKSINVNVGKLFRTKKIASSIPESLRSLRYGVYVNVPASDEDWLLSNKLGAYGLMDEFNAYRMGMGTNIGLYPYYKAHAREGNCWEMFFNYGNDCKLAYAEFKYYILHYLKYAQAKEPEVYRDLVANANFKKAYKTIEKDFKAKVKTFDKDLEKLAASVAKESGGQAVLTDTELRITIGSTTTAHTRSGAKDYQALVKAVSKGRYKALHRKLTE